MKGWRKIKNGALKIITFVATMLVIIGAAGLDGPKSYMCSMFVSWGMVWIFAFYKANWR